MGLRPLSSKSPRLIMVAEQGYDKLTECRRCPAGGRVAGEDMSQVATCLLFCGFRGSAGEPELVQAQWRDKPIGI